MSDNSEYWPKVHTATVKSSSHFPSVVLSNVRSMNNKTHYLPVLKSSHPADVYALTETWLTPETADTVELSGYSHVHCTRTSSGGGGVSVFVSNRFSISYEEKFVPATSGSVQSC